MFNKIQKQGGNIIYIVEGVIVWLINQRSCLKICPMTV